MHYSNLLKDALDGDRPHNIVAKGAAGHLLYLSGKDRDEDPFFYFVTPDMELIELGITGIVKNVKSVPDDREKVIFGRQNGYGNFMGISSKRQNMWMDAIYSEIQSLDFNQSRLENRFNWNSQMIRNWYGNVNALYKGSDIIPEFNDNMILVPVTIGCPRTCYFCSEGGGMLIYDKDYIEEKIVYARDLVREFELTDVMSEVMYNSSDLMWVKIAHDYVSGDIDDSSLNKSKIGKCLSKVRVLGNDDEKISLDDVDPDKILEPHEIIELSNQILGLQKKRYAFLGTPTSLFVGKKYVDKLSKFGGFVNGEEQFRKSAGLYGVLPGVETLDLKLNSSIGKEEAISEKLDALKMFIDAGFSKVKPIFLIGPRGKKFVVDDEVYTSRDTLDETLRIIDQTHNLPYFKSPNVKVQVSAYIPIEDTVLGRLHNSAGLENLLNQKEMKDEVVWFERELMRRGIDVEVKYEMALEGRTKCKIDLQTFGDEGCF